MLIDYWRTCGNLPCIHDLQGWEHMRKSLLFGQVPIQTEEDFGQWWSIGLCAALPTHFVIHCWWVTVWLDTCCIQQHNRHCRWCKINSSHYLAVTQLQCYHTYCWCSNIDTFKWTAPPRGQTLNTYRCQRTYPLNAYLWTVGGNQFTRKETMQARGKHANSEKPQSQLNFFKYGTWL